MLQNYTPTGGMPIAVVFGGSTAAVLQGWGFFATVQANATTKRVIPTDESQRDKSQTPDEEAERLTAIAELLRSLPNRDVLIRWANENRPPQSWYDEQGY